MLVVVQLLNDQYSSAPASDGGFFPSTVAAVLTVAGGLVTCDWGVLLAVCNVLMIVSILFLGLLFLEASAKT